MSEVREVMKAVCGGFYIEQDGWSIIDGVQNK